EKLEKDIQVRLDAIDASPMANKARAGIDFKFNRPTMAGLGLGDDKLLRTAAEYLKKGSDYLAKNSKEVTNALSNVYKFFGGKFKPWGKVKLGRAVEGTGKILGPLAVLGEAYGN